MQDSRTIKLLTMNHNCCSFAVMEEKSWEKLFYVLEEENGDRSLVILSNFQAVKAGWFDTGKYTITENSIALGDIEVDLYTDSETVWTGNPKEFTKDQLDAIVRHITFFDADDDNDAFTDG